ncbi:N-6 DNA methylase [Aliarcobacter butzleri]|uniref:N-6 DNA methylase n=1 Tax=Aliarcobacter butzleri TaxID=28197 RepID=UPI001EE0DBC7|nr:N-6 DNA methylase [Aliarcobacter butzleri]MCG3680173.1 N-6 DNA methylase [Aliarcobacter butzleri]
MENVVIKLNKLIDIIRKDTGINNTMDAMEQLSAFFLLQYFYKNIVINTTKEQQKKDFKSIFFELNYFNTEKKQIDFLKFKNVLELILKNIENIYLRDENFNKIESILYNISFKIRSRKILEMLLNDLDSIDFDYKLAEAYDKLLEKMINESISSGAFYSPKELTTAIVKVINPLQNQSIYDPALGTGRFIIEAQKNLSNVNSINVEKLMKVYGQDISPFAYLVGSLNLLLNGINIKNIELGNSLLDNSISKYDIILCASPFGKSDDIEIYKNRFNGSLSNYETMFLKLTMEKLAVGGKSALIVPDGFLFNTTKEYLSLRKELLRRFNLHSILSLPSGILLPYSGIKISVLFFDNNKSIDDNIWFYELNLDKSLNKSNKIKEEDLIEFVELFPKRIENKNSCLVSIHDILDKNDFNLNIKLSKEINKDDNFEIYDEIQFLKNEKERFNKILDNFNSIIERNKKVNFHKRFILDEIVTVKSGKTLKKEQIKEKGLYAVYGGNGIRGFYDNYSHEGENIIIGRVGAYCGNVHFSKEPVWITNNSFSLVIKSSQNVYPLYLAHILRSMDLNKFARGVAQPAISYEKIKDIEINLPTYEQQVELSEWFERIQSQKEDLIKSIDLQKKKFNDISENLIVSNCIEFANVNQS